MIRSIWTWYLSSTIYNILLLGDWHQYISPSTRHSLDPRSPFYDYSLTSKFTNSTHNLQNVSKKTWVPTLWQDMSGFWGILSEVITAMAVMASELVHCRLRELLLVSGAHPRFINLKNVSNSIAYKPILMRMLRVPILALNIEKGFSVGSLEIRKTTGGSAGRSPGRNKLYAF